MLTRLPYILLSMLLLACCTRPSSHAMVDVDRSNIDSFKHVLRSGSLTLREEMIVSGDIGINYVAAGQYDSARVWLDRALSLPGGREHQGGRFITNLAGSYAARGEYIEALKLYIEALEENSRWVLGKSDWNDQGLTILRATAGISRMYYLTGNLEEAFRYGMQAKAIDEIHGLQYISPQYLYILGAVHLDRGETDEARRVMRQMLELSDEMARRHVAATGDDLGMYMHVGRGHQGLARVALASGDYAGALEHAQEALDYTGRNGNSALVAEVLSLFSDIHLAQGNFPESGDFARRARELYPEHSKLNPDALFNSAAAHLHAGESAEAYEDFSGYAAQMRANTRKQFRETMAGMEVVYETEKKEMRIFDLERRGNLYIAIGLAGLLLAVAVWVILYQKIRNERKEKQLAAANAILEWEKKERKRFASDLHDGINGMLSAVKFQLGTTGDRQAVGSQIDRCIETIRRMARGMMPGSLERYGLKAALEDYCRLFPNVDFHFYGEPARIPERLELTVYYCAYELVNNSFRHSGAENIDVQLVQDGASISLTVQDDGCGFDEQSAAGSSGLDNIRDRVAAFNGRIDIASRPGEGTETNIEFS